MTAQFDRNDDGALQRAAAELANAGVEFVYCEPGPSGVTPRLLPPIDVAAFLRDRDGWLAAIHQVARLDYIAWRADGYTRWCCASTRGGRPCRSAAVGGHNVTPGQWVALCGARCARHEEREGAP